jgi:hypothetical protein
MASSQANRVFELLCRMDEERDSQQMAVAPL